MSDKIDFYKEADNNLNIISIVLGIIIIGTGGYFLYLASNLDSSQALKLALYSGIGTGLITPVIISWVYLWTQYKSEKYKYIKLLTDISGKFKDAYSSERTTINKDLEKITEDVFFNNRYKEFDYVVLYEESIYEYLDPKDYEENKETGRTTRIIYTKEMEILATTENVHFITMPFNWSGTESKILENEISLSRH